jgi:hypothetical protein
VTVRLRVRGLHTAAKGHVPSEVFLAELQDLMSRVDRIVNKGSNSGVGQVGQFGGPEVGPFDGMREVAADIPTT